MSPELIAPYVYVIVALSVAAMAATRIRLLIVLAEDEDARQQIDEESSRWVVLIHRQLNEIAAASVAASMQLRVAFAAIERQCVLSALSSRWAVVWECPACARCGAIHEYGHGGWHPSSPIAALADSWEIARLVDQRHRPAGVHCVGVPVVYVNGKSTAKGRA